MALRASSTSDACWTAVCRRSLATWSASAHCGCPTEHASFASPDTSLALTEVVARNQLLRHRGHDSAREFQEMVATKIAAATGLPASELE